MDCSRLQGVYEVTMAGGEEDSLRPEASDQVLCQPEEEGLVAEEAGGNQQEEGSKG